MTTASAEVEAQKQAAAERALQLVKPGTIVGLGTGSTARFFIEGLAARVRHGLTVQAVVTSLESRALAEAGGPFKTDNGNLVLDTSFGTVDAALGVALHAIPGVIEHGLFFGMARAAIVGSGTGLRVLGELP